MRNASLMLDEGTTQRSLYTSGSICLFDYLFDPFDYGKSLESQSNLRDEGDESKMVDGQRVKSGAGERVWIDARKWVCAARKR